MKKNTFIVLIFAFIIFLSGHRTIPEWSWQVTPQAIHQNYADYFQVYNQTPISVMENGEGVNVVFRVKESNGSSEVFCCYIDPSGSVSIENYGYTGYYCDSEIDQVTGDVFACWHGPTLDVSDGYDCFISYNRFHESGEPISWKDYPVTVINSDSLIAQYPQPTDEFIWPQVHIGPSPLENNRRVYLAAKNWIAIPGETISAGNYLIAYADFCADSLAIQSDLEWQYTTIPYLDGLNAAEPEWGRAKASLAVNDNQLICMGYVSYLNSTNRSDSLFCCINENYGEGNWDCYTAEGCWAVELPEEMVTDPPTIAENLIVYTEQTNLFITDNKVMFPGSAGLTFNLGEGGPSWILPAWCMFYPKTFNFDLDIHEFSFTDVYPGGAEPNDENMMTPWDLDEDGEIDEYDTEGNPLWFKAWPYFHHDEDQLANYNQMYVTGNAENNWLAIVWADGYNAYRAYAGIEGYESWNELPEIAICISDDGGNSWSAPIFINGNPESENYAPELEGMIPCYIYPGDYIEDLGGNEGLLHLFFLDDSEFGSNHNNGEGSTGFSTFQYASITINFQSMDSDENDITEPELNTWNYPNPFNPTTTIAFTLPEDTDNADLNIYNVKGQRVHECKIENVKCKINSVVWEAVDQPSGVYFYKINTKKASVTGRMLLIK